MKKATFPNLILVFAVTVPLSAAMLQVPGQYPTIQAAVDAAQNGDTVIIAPGTYRRYGNWDIEIYDKAITIQSADPNNPDIVAATVIDCNEVQEYYDDYGYLSESRTGVLTWEDT